MIDDYRPGLTSVEQEVQRDDLPVQGAIPAWLRGTLVRNGPGKFEVGARRMRHWFDGLALLHKFSFADGRVDYASKFVSSPAYSHARQHGKIGYAEFATDPCRSIFKRVTTLFAPEFGSNTCVSVAKLADRFVALTESPLPIEFDLRTLETVGVMPFDDDLTMQQTTPHPHLDTSDGAAINHAVSFGKTSRYNVYRIDPERPQRRLIASLPVSEPAYIHSFGLTERHIVIAEYPLVVNTLKLLLSGKAFAENLQWKPQRPAQFHVFRRNDGQHVGSYASAPFFCFHHVNAFEQDGALLVDLLAYPDATVIDKLYLDRLRNPQADTPPTPGAELRRYRLTPGQTSADYETLSDQRMELPTINYARSNGKPYRYMYANGLSAERPIDFLNQLVKVDVTDRTAQVWFEPGCYPGEPIFVAAPDAQAEDDGVVLSVVLDGRQGGSFLLVLDARSFTEIARATVEHAIPFGFHGLFFGEA
jgi:carotenoid cleavage dioxygenase-like enzyme